MDNTAQPGEVMPPYTGFKYWFLPTNNSIEWQVIEKESNQVIGTVLDGILMFPEESLFRVDVDSDYLKFKSRPEYHIGDAIDTINESDQEYLISAYENKLVQISMIRAARAGKDPDLAASVKPATACIDWLRTTDFYTAPGSTVYHDSEPTGLLKHSLRVFNHIVSISKLPEFKSIHLEEAALIALVHDWCKIGLYEMYSRNVKNEETGQWEKVAAFKHNQKGLPLGHGVSSMFFISKFFRLTSEEAVAIRWHMGKWNVADNEVNELQLANESFPLVHLVQFADQLSITKYAN